MDRYSDQLKTHLQENKPQIYRQMVTDGELQEYLELKTKSAYQRKQALVDSGMPDDMAEEIVINELLT